MPSRGRAFAASVSAAVFMLLAQVNLSVAADSNALKVTPAETTNSSVDYVATQSNLEHVASSASALNETVDSADTQAKLEKGEVVVDFIEEAKTKFVVGKILVRQPPEVVWPILVNPFEFQNKICPRMKSVEVLKDQPDVSVLRCSLDVCFMFPTIKYTVESRYDPAKSVEFRRLSGFLKDFRGCWLLRACDHGACTEVMYSMFVDPGIPLPRWLVREGVKSELPQTLIGLRERVNAIVAGQETPQAKTLAAASAVPATLISQRRDAGDAPKLVPSAACPRSEK